MIVTKDIQCSNSRLADALSYNFEAKRHGRAGERVLFTDAMWKKARTAYYYAYIWLYNNGHAELLKDQIETI